MFALKHFKPEYLFDMDVFEWFRHYIKCCDSDVFNAVAYNMNNFVKNMDNSQGINANIIIDYLNQNDDYLLSDFEIKTVSKYANVLYKRFSDAFVPLYIKTYNDIADEKDAFLYLMFSKYEISFDNDILIAREKYESDEFKIKDIEDAFWLYDVEEFKSDLYYCIIENGNEFNDILSHSFVKKSCKHSYFIEDFDITLNLLNELFIDELKNFD